MIYKVPKTIDPLSYDDPPLYAEWTTVADGPSSFAMTETEMRDHLARREFGVKYAELTSIHQRGLIQESLDRAFAQGTSWIDHMMSPVDLISFNRMGPTERRLPVHAVLEYVRTGRSEVLEGVPELPWDDDPQ